MKTLVYHSGALGDFITTLPALAAWKNKFQPHTLILLGKPVIGSLGIYTKCIDEVLDIDDARFVSLFSGMPETRLASVFSSIDYALVFSSSELLIRNLQLLGIKNILHQSPFPSERIPVSNYHLSLVNPNVTLVNSPTKAVFLDMSTTFVHEKGVQLPPSPIIAIHPGSGSVLKNWPMKNFVALSKQLEKNGYSIVWLAGPAEENFLFPDNSFVLRNCSFSLIGWVLSRCKLFVGNDSAIAHLAAAIGCPTIVLFGPSDPIIWQPAGRNVRLIYIEQKCSPCHGTYKKTKVICSHRCMQLIKIEMVYEACTQLLRMQFT